MTLPRELDDADPIPRLLGLDRQRGAAADRVDDVLVEAQPAARDGRVARAVRL